MQKNHIVNIILITLLLLLLLLVLWILLYPLISIPLIDNEAKETLGNSNKRKQIERDYYHHAVLLEFEHGEWIAIYSRSINHYVFGNYLCRSFALDSNGNWFKSEGDLGGFVYIARIRWGKRNKQQLIEAQKLKQIKELYSESYNDGSPRALGLCEDFREAKEFLIKKSCFKKITVR